MTDEPFRTVIIAPARLQPWIDNFRARHGSASASLLPDSVRLIGADGAEATITVPFPPLDPVTLKVPGTTVHAVASGQDINDPSADAVQALIQHVAHPHRVGAVLVRKGGFGVAIFIGDRLEVSKVGSAYVQGKTKAGGWSQQRYARRRDNQSKRAYAEAADEATRILLPRIDDLEAVVTGGDKPAISAVFADPRLADLRGLLLPQMYAVADPRLRVLQAFPEQFLAVRIQLNALA